MSSPQETETVEALSYPGQHASTEGVFTPIVGNLASVAGADRVRLVEGAGGRRLALLFRRGASRVLRLSLVRRTGRWVVEFAAVDRSRVLAAMSLCQEHFDRWFGTTPDRVLPPDSHEGQGDET